MILQPIHHQLTPNNCAVILVDYQSQLALTISSTDEETLIHNAINLAKIAKTFNIPTVLTTIGETSFGGPIFSKLQEIFPDQNKPKEKWKKAFLFGNSPVMKIQTWSSAVVANI